MMKKMLALLMLAVFSAQPVGAFCFEEAGEEYAISPELLWAIAKTESAFNTHALHYNANGSFDYGLMQINSSWYKELGRERWMRLNDGCYNVKVGAWILDRCIRRYGYTWAAVGCYNGVSQDKKVRYANRIYRTLNASKGGSDGNK
jgi:soluble lytic murein transglycosylase-like protein